MKMVRTLLILLGCVALAVAAILILPGLAPEEAEVTAAPTTPPEDLLLSGKKAADVSRFTVTNESGETAYYYDAGEELWKVEGYEDVNLNQSTLSSMAYYAAYVGGKNVIMEDLSNLAEYGLDNPAITVHTQFNDGTEITYYIGGTSPSRDTNYAYLEGGTRIVDLWMSYAKYLTYTIDDLRQVADIPVMESDTIVKARIERRGQEPFQIAQEEASVSLYTWWVEMPWHHLCDTEKLESFLESVAAVKPKKVEAGDPGDLSQYGLDEPSMTLYVENNAGESYIMYVGDAVDSSNTYIMLDGDPVVYSITSSLLTSIDVTPFSMTDKLLSLILINNVDSMSYRGPDARCDIVINKVERLDSEGNPKLDSNGEPIIDNEYVLDGEVIDTSAGSQFYQACLAVHLHSPLTEEFVPAGAPDATLTYALNIEGMNEYVFKFYEYKKDYYAVSINGQIDFVTLKSEVANLTTVLEDVRDGVYDKNS